MPSPFTAPRVLVFAGSARKAALSKRYVWWIKEPLDVERMQQAAALIAGRHDFAAGHCAAGPNAFVDCESDLPAADVPRASFTQPP